MKLSFAHPSWLVIGLIVCTLVFIFLRMSAARRRQALAEFAAPETCNRLTANVSIVRRRLKDTLLIFAVFCCFLALARPQYGEEWIEVRQKGIDILIALDTSRSMLTRDIQPNRLERAKLAIKDFVDRLEGDRIGLIPFAGSSFLMCPLTTDYAAFTASLDALGPDSIPLGGTNIAGVITEAENILSNEANYKILILVTDGEDLEGEALQAAEKAAAQHMTIYTIGVGTPEGELIPNMKENNGTFIKDESGNFVRSKLDAMTLTKIAKITGGLYVPLGNMGQGFTTIYQEKLKLVPKEEHNERMQRHPIERFYWPLALSLVLLALEFLLSGRKSSRSFGIPLIKTAGRRLFNRGKLLIVFIVFLSGFPGNVNGSTGEDMYQAKQYSQAEQEYMKALERTPDNAILHFNLGNVQYKKHEYEKALSSYTKALQSDDLTLQAKGYYNLGNTRYKLGKKSLKTDPEHTMELYRQAISDFEGSLALTPNDQDAAFNRDLVKKQLDELKKQQQKKQQQKKQQQKKQQQKEKQQKKKKDKKDKKDKQDKTKQEQKNKGDSGGDKKQSQPDSSQKNKKQQNKDAGEQSRNQNKQTGSDQNSREKGMNKNAAEKKEQKANKDSGNNEKKTPQQKQVQKNGGKGGSSANKSDEKGTGMNAADKKRRQQGKMTTREARNLLDALEDEEGRLDFIPKGMGNKQDQPLRNW